MVETIICCINWQNYAGKGAEYVNILYDMVRRNLSEDFKGRFVCFTDDDKGLNKGIESHPLPSLRGWYNKLWLFNKDLFPAGARIVYFDLDTLICGSIDELCNYQGRFAILRDFYRPEGLGSAIMLWRAGDLNYIWEAFEAAGCPEYPGGDQAWIEKLRLNPDILQDRLPDQIVSYKAHCKLGLPPKAKIVCFHGEPKNHNCNSPWVEAIWKIGGLSKFDTEVIGNVPDEVIAQNIKHAITLPHIWLEKGEIKDNAAVILGGGPSGKKYIPQIREAQRNGNVIFALNNSYRFLEEHGICADYQVMLDPRPENAAFVSNNPRMKAKLYASTCHADVFTNAQGKVIIWHPAVEGIDTLIEHIKAPKAFIGGGCNVGLKAMCIAYTMGYRKLILFGFDSSYEEGAHHAYAQPLNDNERILDVTADNYRFKAAPWMVTQANEFQTLAPELIKLGCEIQVFGNGLLPYIAYKMEVVQAA